MTRRPPRSPLFPTPPLSGPPSGRRPAPRPGSPARLPAEEARGERDRHDDPAEGREQQEQRVGDGEAAVPGADHQLDRKSTRLNSSHANISYAVFCLKKKKTN